MLGLVIAVLGGGSLLALLNAERQGADLRERSASANTIRRLQTQAKARDAKASARKRKTKAKVRATVDAAEALAKMGDFPVALTGTAPTPPKPPSAKRKTGMQRGIEAAAKEARARKRAATKRANPVTDGKSAMQRGIEAAAKAAAQQRSEEATKRIVALGKRDAAQQLYAYVNAMLRAGKADLLGDKAKPNGLVRGWQQDMGKLTADGIYGPKTRTRGKELLGREFPSRTQRLPAAPPKTAAPTQRTPVQAAEQLYKYVTAMKAAGKSTSLGYKNQPNITVQTAQRDMGGLVADGIYGPATRSRGRDLIKKQFPAR